LYLNHTYNINISRDETNNPRKTHNKRETGIQMETCAFCGRIAQVGPCGLDETCAPEEEDHVEDHDDQEGPNSEDQKPHRISDITISTAIGWSQVF
jgi:hypothetical protein